MRACATTSFQYVTTSARAGAAVPRTTHTITQVETLLIAPPVLLDRDRVATVLIV